MESTSSAVTMCATVLRVCPCELCVCDHENCQQLSDLPERKTEEGGERRE